MSLDEKDSALLGVLVDRVARLESDRQEDRRARENFSNRVDQQFADLRLLITSTVTNAVAGIRYVDAELYKRDRRELELAVAEAKADAERGIKIAWGIAVAFAVPFIGGLASIIMKAAG